MIRTHTCGQLTEKDIGKTVKLAGWVYRRRDHGGLIFIDLRDRYGITQLTFNPQTNKAAWEQADLLRSEWVIKIYGKVINRSGERINKKLKTGKIEVECDKIEVLSESKPLPFEIDEEKKTKTNENLRLKYRFLDLRRKKLQNVLIKRDEAIQYIRHYFENLNFVEIQTPILANSSPEGARDYLIPSRLHNGKFYALPQAPQQFKQLLMAAGFDRYFQIAPCFRDEDPRADRHPGDFYQIDMEMSFCEQEDILKIIEPLMIKLTEKFSDKEIIKKPFQRITWLQAMNKYGSDKPDLRFDLEIKQITEIVKNCGFAVFANAIKQGGVVHALKIENGAKFTRAQIDNLTEIAKNNGAKGLAYIVVKDFKNKEYKLQSPIVKFLGNKLAQQIVKKVNAKTGDIIFFGADKWLTVCKALGAVRNKCASLLNLKNKNKLSWVWIVDFPMYEISQEKEKIDFSHNPFSMPQGGLKSLETKNPLDIIAYQFDLACNGYEVSSGAIRNHRVDIMYKAFAIAGYSKKEVDKKFGHMIRAFQYGTPPHGGFAPGLDRILMILWDLPSIRDNYAFPKDGQARDVMMNTPSEINEKQLKDLGLKIIE